jgi:outer membrane putative beta-barrel porin/alpha-amylase
VKRDFVIGFLFLILAIPGLAQDLEPHAYSASPVGLNFAVLGFGRSTGSVLFDPTLPISNVKANLNIPTVGYGRTFGLFGRQALLTAGLPYVWGDISGDVSEQRRSIRRSGLADVRMKLSVNLRGNPARSRAEFAKFRKRTFIVGTSVTVTAPTGQYDPAKLINIGTNRWAFKPELGISYPVKKSLDLDLYFGAWLFTHNADFFPGNKLRQQDPITTLQGHISYTFRPRLWIAADMTWYRGGAATVDHGAPIGEQNNSRAGVTFSVPLGAKQSLKFAYSDGTTARIGSDFKTLNLAWQFSWFDH